MESQNRLSGFAAETEHIVEYAEKRPANRVDLMVVNDVSRIDIGFDCDDNEDSTVLPVLSYWTRLQSRLLQRLFYKQVSLS